MLRNEKFNSGEEEDVPHYYWFRHLHLLCCASVAFIQEYLEPGPLLTCSVAIYGVYSGLLLWFRPYVKRKRWKAPVRQYASELQPINHM